jgi:hypothetical protein
LFKTLFYEIFAKRTGSIAHLVLCKVILRQWEILLFYLKMRKKMFSRQILQKKNTRVKIEPSRQVPKKTENDLIEWLQKYQAIRGFFDFEPSFQNWVCKLSGPSGLSQISKIRKLFRL